MSSANSGLKIKLAATQNHFTWRNETLNRNCATCSYFAAHPKRIKWNQNETLTSWLGLLQASHAGFIPFLLKPEDKSFNISADMMCGMSAVCSIFSLLSVVGEARQDSCYKTPLPEKIQGKSSDPSKRASNRKSHCLSPLFVLIKGYQRINVFSHHCLTPPALLLLHQCLHSRMSQCWRCPGGGATRSSPEWPLIQKHAVIDG